MSQEERNKLKTQRIEGVIIPVGAISLNTGTQTRSHIRIGFIEDNQHDSTVDLIDHVAVTWKYKDRYVIQSTPTMNSTGPCCNVQECM